MDTTLRDLVFNRVSPIVSKDVPNMKNRLKELKQEIQYTETELNAANNLVKEACDQFGFEVQEFSFEEGGTRLIKKEVPL